MNTTNLIQHYIQKIPRGKPFVSTTLLKFGARTAVDQALSRLASAGKITRVTRGIYVRPEQNRFVGKVLPEPFKVAEIIAKKTNETIQVSGAEAARQFGFTTQVSAQPVFFTTGQSRRFKIGNLEISLKHVSKKKLPFPESKIGLAILALWHLGKHLTTLQTIEAIKNKLTHHEFERFRSSKEYMPAWMASVIFEYEKENKNILRNST